MKLQTAGYTPAEREAGEQGVVFDIQHFCVDDGPGIRTAVFLKGCPLRCIWCHNAEGLSAKPQLYFTRDNCTGCGRCAPVCPHRAHSLTESGHRIDRTECTACGACAGVCPAEALRIAGRVMTAPQVLAEVAKDKPFFRNSGGGMTLSGGEPLAQGAFSVRLAQLAKAQGIHVCVETSGYGSPEALRRLAEHTDVFLYDYKHSSPQAHKSCTGVDNALILENLELLSGLGRPVILRCPVIPGCNDTPEHYRAIAQLAQRMDNITGVHIEPYHPFGVSKYDAVGRSAAYGNNAMMDRAAAQAAADAVAAGCTKPVLLT